MTRPKITVSACLSETSFISMDCTNANDLPSGIRARLFYKNSRAIFLPDG